MVRNSLRVFGCVVVLLVSMLALAQSPAPRLKVSANGHWLQYADNRPFFYLGDTAWELFRTLTREQADRYLGNRAQKGFTAIQAAVLAGGGPINGPNAYGDKPLIDGDPAKPNEAYFRQVDYVVDRAASLGMFIGMLPTWGRYWTRYNKKPPYMFNVQNARAYGLFLGSRYRDKPVIWILGGDQAVHTPEERAVLEAMAAGLREGDGGAHLITYHPRGPGMSSDYFPQDSILHFNMYQSSHGAHDHDNGLFAEHDYALTPPKPTLDGEPRYETIPVGFYYPKASKYDRMDDYDVRQAAFWSVLAGACGHTYGNNNIWQMWEPDRPPLIEANKSWEQSLDDPGAFQMGILRRLFESRPYQKLVPERKMIVEGPASGGAKVRAELADDGSFAFIYSPRGKPFTVDRSRLKAQRIREIWFDPRYGVSYHFHTSDNTAYQTYTPPTSGRGQDWVLVLEDDAANFPPPGSKPYIAQEHGAAK